MIKTVLTVKESPELLEQVKAELEDNKQEKSIGAILDETTKKLYRRISVEDNRDDS